jgi:(5-formylfuran-3-yl)methyl phosphate synthase
VTGLLISVRSSAEAEVVLEGGADIIDVKEPGRGALGPADPEVWREIQLAVGRYAITSVALGELLSDPVDLLAPQTAGFRYAKIGLAGCHKADGWIRRWETVVREFPRGTLPVPVAYADWPSAVAPSPSVALWLAQRSAARLLLVDTHDKRRGALLDVLSWETLRELARDAKEAGVQLALAGSLTRASIEKVQKLSPAYIGVRGAACVGGRSGTIDLARVKSLARVLRSAQEKTPA